MLVDTLKKSGFNLARALSKAWVQFLIVAALVFLIPGVLGHPFASGDNLIQFNPLRVLAGKIEAKGNLPLWNQFIWSGTPLLAGFNAGVFLPTSWPYIFLPPSTAWGIAQGLPYFFAALGFYRLMKELGNTDFASRLTGLSFAFSGVMIGQGVHLDMITGISMAPWLLLCASRILEPGSRSKFRDAIYLAITYAVVVLAGAPEAMLDELIVLLVYSTVRLFQLRTAWLKNLLWLAGAGILALGLSAAQWVPGLAFQKISQRASPSYAFVSFGAFAPQYFYSFFAPYLFGGPGAVPMNGYFGPFTWEEVTIYPTIGPIIALFATIGRTIRKSLESKLIPFAAIAVVGIILALGPYTPLESLTYHIPLYGQQRLQGRNILAFDVAIFAFFAIWLDRITVHDEKKNSRLRWLSFLPAAVVLVLYVAFFHSPQIVSTFFHASTLAPAISVGNTAIVFAITFATALLSGIVYFVVQKNRPKSAKYLIVSAVVLDLVFFNIFGGLGTSTHLAQFNADTPAVVRLHALLGDKYRFALYDPLLYDYRQINAVGQPDLNISAGNLSIGGYGSLAIGSYQAATSTHTQDSFAPSLLASPLIDTLGTKVLITTWQYLITRYGSTTPVPLPYFYLPAFATSPTPPATAIYPDFRYAPTDQSPTDTTGLFGRTLNVSSVNVGIGHTFAQGSIQRVGLLMPNNSITWLSPAGTMAPDVLRFKVSTSGPTTLVPAVGVVVRQLLPVGILDPQKALVTGVGVDSSQGYFAITGPLSSYLTYPHYLQIGNSLGFTTFENSQAKQLLQVSGQARITQQSTDLNGTLHLSVHATSGSIIRWAEAYAPGWQVRYNSETSNDTILRPTIPDGPLQMINVPPGDWKITVFYDPSSAHEGLDLTLLFAALTLVLLAINLYRQRSHTPSPKPQNMKP